MTDRSEVLSEVMHETLTSQSELSRLSGVRQPSISGFISGKVDLSDTQLDRLLSCMGYRLEVRRRPVMPELTRSERRSWHLHRRLSSQIDTGDWERWSRVMRANLDRLDGTVTGQPHLRNVQRWRVLVDEDDLLSLKRVLTGLDRDSVEMREVSPMTGLLPDEERRRILSAVR